MECVWVRFGFAESSNIDVDLVPPPDDSDHPAKYFRRKFLQALIADDQKPGWHGVVIPGTLLEVADYLWQHQELYLHMHSPEQNTNPDDAPMASKHISVAFSEILDPDDLLSSAGPYVKRMTFSDDLPEALTVTLRLESFSTDNPPQDAPPVPMAHAFALQVRARMDMESMQKLSNQLMPTAEAGNGEEQEPPSVIVQYGAVQQHLHLLGEDVHGGDLSHFHLVLVENWAELAMWSQTLAKVQIYIPANGGSESRCCNLDLAPIIQGAKRNRGSPTNEPFDVTCQPEGQEFAELGFHCELGPLALDGLADPTVNEQFSESVNRPGYSSHQPNPHVTANQHMNVPAFMSPERGLSPFKQQQHFPQQPDTSAAREVLNSLGSEIHNWRVSVEVKSLKLLVDTGSVYCKYLYPPFRQTKAFKTNPPVPARKNATVHLPSPFCQYSLPMMADELRDALSSGLRLEIWNRDAYKTDTCLGTATIDVKKVADANFACVGTKRDDNQYVVTGSRGCIGSVRVVLYLEDAGSTGSSAPAAGVVAAEQAQPNGPGANIRGSPEYSVAFELEVWKKAEETKFRAHLKEQENNMRDQLDRAFAEKEKAREQQWSQQQREFANVESRLRKQLGEVQQREARVSSEEERLKRTLEDVDRSAKHQLEEYLSAARRAQEESEHKVKLEQDKVASGQRRIADLEQDLQIQRKRYLELEQELESFRREARNQGLSNLQADLRLRDYRIQELENKLQSAVASRDHFKNAFQEMALKAGQYVPPAPSDAGVPQSPMVEPSASSLGANTVGTNLSRPPASGGLKSDEFVEVLRSMKNEFANLGEKVAASPAPTARTMRTNFIDSTPRPATALNSDADPMSIRKNLDAELEEKDPKIAALEKQRSELLSTGLYNMNDKLIQALDRKIQNGGE